MGEEFTFDSEKAIQATAVILREEPGHRMNYMKLLKLLAIAERESLGETGTMITGDSIVAMERGPVPSRVYDLIKGENVHVPRWSQFIEKDRYHVALVQNQNPGVGMLSRFAIEKLQEVTRRHRDDDEWDMVQITHKHAEWIKNEPSSGCMQPISTEDILNGVGRADIAQEVVSKAIEQKKLDDFFTRHGACSEATPS